MMGKACRRRPVKSAGRPPELGPYLCATDFATMRALGIGLARGGTIAGGCARCDFRMTVGGPITPLSVTDSR